MKMENPFSKPLVQSGLPSSYNIMQKDSVIYPHMPVI